MTENLTLPIEELPDALGRVRTFLSDHCDDFGVVVIDVAVVRLTKYQAALERIAYGGNGQQTPQQIAQAVLGVSPPQANTAK
jgi:hypothetical protein